MSEDFIDTETETPADKAGAESEQPADDAIAAKPTGEESDEDNDDGAPETYADFDLPEGFQMNSEYMAGLTSVLKELNVSQANAQKLIDFHVSQVQAGEGNRVDSLNQLKAEWLGDTKKDAEIGGDNFEQSANDARAAVEKFGTPELKALLRDTGIGNNPEIIRVFSKIGKLMREDVPGDISDDITNSPEKKSTLDILYPNSSQASDAA